MYTGSVQRVAFEQVLPHKHGFDVSLTSRINEDYMKQGVRVQFYYRDSALCVDSVCQYPESHFNSM